MLDVPHARSRRSRKGPPDRSDLLRVENERLVAQLQASLDELSESRMRILAVADQTRQQIGRDLHDGAQQGLFLLRLKLSAEADRLRAEHPDVAESLDHMGAEVEETVEQVRALCRGIYPATLAGHGLADSLRWAALGDPLVVSVETDGVGRYDAEVERAVYFACLEALHNTAKHAGDPHQVWIALVDDGALCFEVRDDGAGWAPDTDLFGTGLAGIRDRIAAVGGDVEIDSVPGRGTRVRGRIPRPGRMAPG